jgi:hypothetical protein
MVMLFKILEVSFVFIQRLKIKDIAEFVYGLDFNSISVNLCNCTKEPYLRLFFDRKNILNKNLENMANHINANNNLCSININARLYDFESIGINRNWQEFLYKKFGQEYKEAYERYITNTNKLDYLIL